MSTPIKTNVPFGEDKSTNLKIDFVGKRRIFYAISITLILVGIITSIFTIKLDIQFTGGAIIQYSYSGSIDVSAAQRIANKQLKTNVTATTENGTKGKLLVLQVEKSSKQDITNVMQESLYTALVKQFPSNSLERYQSNVVNPEMGAAFFMKSIGAVVLASLLILIYIWFRFRKIGGLPAGVTALIALIHDVLMVFAAFAIFQIPLNDTFIAVTLTILGYSINDTIVVYDRIRENRTIVGNKVHFTQIVNRSINQSFVRSINTTLCTFMAILVVLIFSLVFHLSSITEFALPMMVGVITGCYSTICIAGPLWTTWVEYKEKKNPPRGAVKKLKPAKA